MNDLATPHRLDDPIWSALTSRHRHLGTGDDRARRYQPDVAPFAAVAPGGAPDWAALRSVLRAGDEAAILAREPIGNVAGLDTTEIGLVHQMIAVRQRPDGARGDGVIALQPADAADMLELATLTKPGPFSARTHETGRYIGIRDGGRLIAMAGERMRMDGHVEVSAVCVHDEYRGRGLASRLIKLVRQDIEVQGDAAFLHVFSSNLSAIALYEHLGFELRQVFHLVRVRAQGGAAAAG
jgi:predicted GNAT family acetyltransferase